MNDEASIAGWQEKFDSWVAFAQPLLAEGKAQDAFAKYPWFTTEGDPFTLPEKPVSEMRFGLITTGGYFIDGEQEPMRAYPTFGDEVPEYRKIPLDVDRSRLRIKHPGYDHKYAREDVNANLPPDRLTELVADGTIGSHSEETIVLMGLQPNAGPLIRKTIPKIVGELKANNVEAALLVPS